MNQKNLAEEIEQIYRESFGGEFSYEDCFRLHKMLGPSDDLIPDFDTYFATIAGYSSSASRLRNRSVTEFQRATRLLSVDAYQRFPSLERYRPYITEENTPRLMAFIRMAEELRLRLLILLNSHENSGLLVEGEF